MPITNCFGGLSGGPEVLTLIASIGRFCRLPLVGLTEAVIGVGAASTGSAISLGRVWILLLIGLLFHIGVFILNDVMDVEIDRTDSRRARAPVAAGTVSPAYAVAVAAASLTAGAAILFTAENSVAPLACYGSATAGLVVYDLHGKRFAVPPVTDMVQGIGWGSLVLMSAALIGQVDLASLILAVSTCLYMAILTGFSGSLRDLINDRYHGANTTPIFFMNRAGSKDEGNLLAPYISYGLVLQILQAATCIVGVATLASQLGRGGDWYWELALTAQAACLLLLWIGLARYSRDRRMWVIGLAHSILSFWAILLAVLVRYGVAAFTLASVLLIGPWSCSSVVRAIVTNRGDWAGRETARS